MARRGGKARAAKLTSRQRSEIARNAALKRWSKRRKKCGKCALCLQTRRLEDSHFLPAALYRGLLDHRLKDPNPVHMTKHVSRTTSNQMHNYLLCKDCEHRFNKYGEAYVLKWLAPKKVRYGSFPLFERLNVALELRQMPGIKSYSAANVGIDTAKFAYFALSILWRAAVHRWLLPDGNLRDQINLGEYEEPIRNYLLNAAPFPDNVVVVLTVCTDPESRGTLYPPTLRRGTAFQAYGFLTLGVHFDISMGKTIPSGWRACCCASSPRPLIFSRSCLDRTFRAFASLASTSKPVRKLLPR